MAANNSIFLDEDAGATPDPFGAGLGPDATEEERQAARRARLRTSATNTANINNAPGGYSATRGAGDREIIAGSNEASIADRRARGRMGDARQRGLFGNLIRDPATMAVLAAPYGVVGAGLAVGGPSALGFGEAAGSGSLVGGPEMAFKDTIVPTITRTPSLYPGGIAAPGAAGATTGAAGGTTGAIAGGSSAAAAGAAGWGLKDTIHAGIPILGAAADIIGRRLFADDGEKEKKALLAKQEQIAAEVSQRREQAAQVRMDNLAQQVMAFNPQNQLVAQMMGPQYAFTPEQMAGMVQNPAKPQLDPSLVNYKGGDDKKQQMVEDYIRKKAEYEAAEQRRRDMVMGGFQQPGPGPAPLNPIKPLPAKRY